MQQEKTEQLAQDVIHAPQDFNRDSISRWWVQSFLRQVRLVPSSAVRSNRLERTGRLEGSPTCKEKIAFYPLGQKKGLRFDEALSCLALFQEVGRSGTLKP